jgi:hypothetical protein
MNISSWRAKIVTRRTYTLQRRETEMQCIEGYCKSGALPQTSRVPSLRILDAYDLFTADRDRRV